MNYTVTIELFDGTIRTVHRVPPSRGKLVQQQWETYRLLRRRPFPDDYEIVASTPCGERVRVRAADVRAVRIRA